MISYNKIKINEMSGCVFCLIVFFVSQALILLQEVIPLTEYVAIALFLVLSVFTTKKISIEAIKYMVISMSILLFGTLISRCFGVYNENFLLCIAFSLKVLLFCNVVMNKKIKINKIQLSNFFDVILVYALITCTYNMLINFRQMFSLSITMNAYMAIFSSFYSGRNAFAAFLSLYMLICIYQILDKRKIRYGVLLGLLTVNLLLTFSRAALLFVAISVSILLVLRTKKDAWKKLFLFCMVLLGLAVLVIILQKYYTYIDHFLIRSNYGDSNRFMYWKSAMEMLKKSPLVGMGAGCAEFVLTLTLGENAGSSFHNTYIEILLWGGACFGMLYFCIYRRAIKALYVIRKEDSLFFDLYISFLIGFFVYCFFETSMLFAMGGKADFTTIIFFVIPMLYKKI